jgi:HSP20 family protein
MSRSWSSPILDLQRRLDELFEEVIFRRWPIAAPPSEAWMPAADVYELASAYLILVDLPGCSADDIHVEIGPRSITISGRRVEALPPEVHASHRERLCGAVRRTFDFTHPIDTRQVEVAWRDGLLRIVAPRTREDG